LKLHQVSQQSDNGNLRDIVNQYAKRISAESDTIKKIQMKKECQQTIYSHRLIESASRMLRRRSPFSTGPNTMVNEIDAIRRNAGSKITKTPMLEETRAITNFYRKKHR
jgi:hypothetical protein